MWTALSAAPASSTSPGKLMMIGWATPTVEPLAGTNLGGPNGAAPVNGVGSCPAAGARDNPWIAGSRIRPSAGPVLSTSTQPNIEATPAAFRAAKRLPLVQPDIYIPPVTSWKQSRIAPRPAISSAARPRSCDCPCTDAARSLCDCLPAPTSRLTTSCRRVVSLGPRTRAARARFIREIRVVEYSECESAWRGDCEPCGLHRVRMHGTAPTTGHGTIPRRKQ